MPAKAAEIYTYPPDAQTAAAVAARRSCLCRFRGLHEECSQIEHRGNRAFVTIADHPGLVERYGRERIPLGLCSMWDLQRDNPEPWVVCPHRLFYAGSSTGVVEQAIYQAWGLARGDRVALWKEVKLISKARNKRFDFTFDYVFRKVVGQDPLECEDVPYLVEVMTASTTGGGVENTFVNGLTNASATTRTGINRRQVLARMMSQFIAKAQAAFEWGGKAVWIVQDLLWQYVGRTTGFSRDDFYDDPKGNVVVLVRQLDTTGYQPANVQSDNYTLRLQQIVRGWDRFEKSKGETYEGRDFVSMLNAPFTPDRKTILRLTSRPPVAILTCA
jgi:hypothetical protein